MNKKPSASLHWASSTWLLKSPTVQTFSNLMMENKKSMKSVRNTLAGPRGERMNTASETKLYHQWLKGEDFSDDSSGLIFISMYKSSITVGQAGRTNKRTAVGLKCRWINSCSLCHSSVRSIKSIFCPVMNSWGRKDLFEMEQALNRPNWTSASDATEKIPS